ncbi:PilN domain-containing protein [Verminephrobacter eiseniae]|uniref:PilN domain-containing protein n=1 Tax=Verminephrobacter eiseniae TaxID=364317 RepID=UPI0022388382|nr:PilN domain-containing protein [Verminephrobacter eiseniae]MCW5235989.1 fimbrial assembly protein [Verminephrobacter eiseniae]
MAFIHSDDRFFGMDLAPLRRDLGQAWAGLRSGPLLSWISPMQPVRLLQADGSESLWQAREGAPQKSSPRAGTPRARFLAVELPDELLLRRSLQLPPMPAASVQEAVALDLRSSSPFAEDDLVWGYTVHASPPRGLQVDGVLASGKQIAQYLLGIQECLRAAAGASPAHPASPEVWATVPGRAPVVLRGFAETQRYRAVARQQVTAWALLASMAALLLAIAITPTLQMRLRAIEAVNAFTALSQRTAALLREREALLQVQTQLTALQAILAERVDPLRVMELLTQALPDDTTVFTLQIQGSKVSLTGQTGNAAALMQLLSAHPVLRDVRAPTAAMRPPGASKDIFSIELTLDTKALAPSAPSIPSAPAAPGTTATPPAPAAAQATP